MSLIASHVKTRIMKKSNRLELLSVLNSLTLLFGLTPSMILLSLTNVYGQDDASNFHVSAVFKVSEGDFNGALIDFNKAIELYEHPYAKAYVDRGMLRMKLSDFQGAIRDFDKALDIDSSIDNATAYNNRGSAKMYLKNYKDAISDYDRAIGIEPHYVYYGNRGYCKLQLDDFHGAIADYTTAINLNPNDFDHYFQRAYCKHSIGEYWQAIMDYNAFLQANPEFAPAYYYRGMAQCLRGRIDEGCEDFLKAGTTGFDRGEFHYAKLTNDAMSKFCE